MGIGADPGIEKIELAAPEAGISLVDAGPTLSQGFDFRALERYSRLIKGVDGVFKKCLAVAADGLDSRFFHRLKFFYPFL
jgi:hypothetical protein